MTLKGIKEKDIIIIATDHSVVDYEMVTKNAKAIFDTRNVIKLNSEKIDRL